MDYTTARVKIAQKQLREWKKNRGTALDCSIHNKRAITIADRITAKVAENRERTIEDITLVRRLIRDMQNR